MPWHILIHLVHYVREKLSVISIMGAIVFASVCYWAFGPIRPNPVLHDAFPELYQPGGLCALTSFEGLPTTRGAACYVNLFGLPMGGMTMAYLQFFVLIIGAILGLEIGAYIDERMRRSNARAQRR